VSYLVRKEQEAEDVAQDALAEVIVALRSFRGESSLEHWADRIALRVVSLHIRKSTRYLSLVRRVEESHIPRNVDTEVAMYQCRRRLAEHLDRISPDRRMAIVLHHVLGYGVAEIAEMTETPVNTVRDRLSVGKKQLRKRILKDPVLREWEQLVTS
jgi:RNA polymerase sigma-70 factor (ECF subfamily)